MAYHFVDTAANYASARAPQVTLHLDVYIHMCTVCWNSDSTSPLPTTNCPSAYSSSTTNHFSLSLNKPSNDNTTNIYKLDNQASKLQADALAFLTHPTGMKRRLGRRRLDLKLHRRQERCDSAIEKFVAVLLRPGLRGDAFV